MGRSALSSWALLDDADGLSRLYESPDGCVTALWQETPDQTHQAIGMAFEQVEQALQQGQYVVWLSAYELAQYWNLPVISPPTGSPLIEALWFRSVRRLTSAQVNEWLNEKLNEFAQEEPGFAGILNRQWQWDKTRFVQEVERVQQACAEGKTYQVNLSDRVLWSHYGHPIALYQGLRARQPVPFGALIRLPPSTLGSDWNGGSGSRLGSWSWVLSFSPELFIRKTGDGLLTQPMKGTAPATGEPLIDAQTAHHLQTDAKTRAENLMIVDLLRNDLGKVAHTGSVKTTALLDVKPYGQVLQMTSCIEAKVRPDVRWKDLLAALYPCGSVTGAPKKQAMAQIAAQEDSPRGLYCGALGWIDPIQTDLACAWPYDLCLSVPIRTMTLDENGQGVLGVGAGMTYDSVATSEWEECQTKARFLTHWPATVGLFETLRAEKGQMPYFSAHLARLAHSAQALGIPWDRQAAQTRLQETGQQIREAGCELARIRLDLSPQGAIHVQWARLNPLSSLSMTLLRVGIAPWRISPRSALHRHKTTHRVIYDQTWRWAEEQGCFDALLFDVNGHLLEGGRSTVFLRLKQQEKWVTPALAQGVLAGVMRGHYLGQPGYEESERPLTLRDVQQAEAIALTNALRGWMPVTLGG
jgi:para-aminobenzoate synthetase/4-amino-4-deoxychorismate lyase